jgi:hypothetical protein
MIAPCKGGGKPFMPFGLTLQKTSQNAAAPITKTLKEP